MTLICESVRKIDGLWEVVMDDEFHRSFAFRFDSEPEFTPGKTYTVTFEET